MTRRERRESIIKSFTPRQVSHAFLRQNYGETGLLLSQLTDEAVDALARQLLEDKALGLRLRGLDLTQWGTA